MPITLDRTPTLNLVAAGDDRSPQAFASAFQFLRTHSDGRYSDRTLMTVSRWEGRSDAARRGDLTLERVPTVFTLATEVSYDEETEVKSGGTLATAVCLPSDDGARVVLATARSARRNGHARNLVDRVIGSYPNPRFWVGNANPDGQKFLLSCGLLPWKMNDSNAIMFARFRPEEEELVAR